MKLKCKVLKNNYCEISNEYSTSHQAIDLVGSNYSLDYVTAHSDGRVVEVVKNCTENTSGELKYNSKRVANIYGNYVKLLHGNGMYTLYAHLKYGSVNVNVGENVKEKAVIGYMGNTGYSFGAHLHFEVRDKNNMKIDPTQYIDSSLGEEYILTDTKEYTLGDYICLYAMNVREGASIKYNIKRVYELTLDGKKNAVYKMEKDNAVYSQNTVFTALKIYANDDGSVWAKTPSGYVCIKDNNMVYCKKV